MAPLRRTPGALWRVGALIALATVIVAATGETLSRSRPPSSSSPAQVTARTDATKHFEYVVSDGALYVYSIDQGNRLVQKVDLPQVGSLDHGVVASPTTGMLYVSYGNQGPPSGSLLAYDLRRSRVVWTRTYPFGIDSMAISPDGKTIYMPGGEASTDDSWRLIDARSGTPTGAVIHAGAGGHNTIMGADGRHLYLGAVDYPYLEVASTATNQIVKKIGPLNGPGVRPFTINGRQTLAFTTTRPFLGFQVGSITTGRVLYTIPVPGFSFDASSFGRTPNHGIALAPDERELYLIDTPNGYVHVFDIRGLPSSPPKLVDSIKLVHAPPNDGWLQPSRDGRYVYVGRSGDVIQTATRKIVTFLAPVQKTADFLEIDWRKGRPVATTSRYGVGYVRGR
jgi:DNA-binding beta-propeller fold protein YncE